MSGWSGKRVRLVLLASLALISAAIAAPASWAGPGLPRTYQVQKVDPPADVGTGDTFGFQLINGGDLGGGPGGARDGKDDIVVGAGNRILNDGTAAEPGEVDVLSGSDGSVIRRIPPPDPDPVCTTATVNRCPAFGFYITRIGQNASAAPFTDLGSCPGGNTDADPYCDAATVGAPDGVPDLAVSAIFVDDTATGPLAAPDIGAVYVIDGATFTVLKRINMPQADVNDMQGETEQLNPAAPATPERPWFGRTVLNPAGQSPCAGNYGVGACPATPIAVRRGDLDGGGSPDLVIGASAYKYEEAEGNAPPSCGDNGPQGAADVCLRSGRAYMYRGEDIVGTSPDTALREVGTGWNIKNPYAQEDDPNARVINQLELFGHSVAPVGDLGACTAAGAPGTPCPPANIGAADGKPEVLVADFRSDYPITGPDNEDNYDIGVNLLLDGATGRILQTYRHPDPDPGSVFGFTIANMPAIGDLGSTSAPDVFIPAGGQDTDSHRGEGIGFVMNGALSVTGNTTDIQRFRDPTPNTSGSFGTTAAGVGDLVGDAKNEILIGEFPAHNPPTNDQVLSDVHFFDPVTGDALQTIADPDQQKVDSFGVGLAPLGDLNGDGFLDFSVSAPRFDVGNTTDVGRVYIFTSDNSPAPPGPVPTSPTTSTSITQIFASTAVTLSGRTIDLDASRSSVRRGQRVTLAGDVDSLTGASACEQRVPVELQRRIPGRFPYQTFKRFAANRSGGFASRFTPTRTYLYRAVVRQTSQCAAASSARARVTVTPRRRTSARR